VLARCVADGRAIAQGLATYESLRRPRTSRIQAGSRRNAWLFHLSGIPAWLRNRQVASARGTMLDWLYRYDAFEPLPGERP
jgi:salicylate hydroxylase